MLTAIATGFLIGLVGSVHCIGMCGPIAIVLPVHRRGTWGFYLGRLLYNLGRTATYAVFGAIIGLVGRQFFAAGLQQEVSIAVGGAMIVTALLPRLMARVTGNVPAALAVSGRLKKIFSAAFQQRTVSSLFIIGAVNGFLPCGLVYMAMAGAATTGSVADGAAFMAGFGMGTVPLMLAVSVAGSFIPLPVRRTLSRLSPVFIVLLGLLLLLRGLNLGIPMVSPKIPVQTSAALPAYCT